MPFTPTLSRRAVLRGIGASLTLPWLPSLIHAEDPGAVLTGPPKRWAGIIFANGVYEPTWGAEGAGAAMKLKRALEPLAPYKEDLLVFNGLHVMDRFPGVSGGPHTGKFSNFLSGAGITNTKTPHLAQSIDHFMADRIGKLTPVPTLTLGVEPPQLGFTGGVPKVYYSTCSWSTETTPCIPEISPRRAFDRLFDTSSLERDQSVLDAALSQAKSLRGRLAKRDQRQLDQYLQSIRDIEHRIAMATSEERFEQWQPSIDKPWMDRPEDGKDWSVPVHHELMADILVLALQMDKTRIATLLMNADTSGMKFDFLDDVSAKSMHGGISHHQKHPVTIEEYQKVNTYHYQVIARAIGKMKEAEEGDGTLLDNTMLFFGSNLMDGDSHDASHLPICMAGGRNCGIKPGRVLTYDQEDERILANLHLSCAQKMGIDAQGFGNSTMPLPGLEG